MNYKPVGSKWVFKVKRKLDGIVDKFKAYHVPKGYNQHLGLAYHETFSHVVKLATIITILSIVLVNGWELSQLDVNNSFLHGPLSKIEYMVQSLAFKEPTKPNYVCRLRKVIYVLKHQGLRKMY